jgi:hypothetical protein
MIETVRGNANVGTPHRVRMFLEEMRMRKFYSILGLAALAALGLAQPASAQQVPDIRGMSPFTVSTNFMSLPGYVRWQYFLETEVWITRAEAIALVRAQVPNAPI